MFLFTRTVCVVALASVASSTSAESDSSTVGLLTDELFLLQTSSKISQGQQEVRASQVVDPAQVFALTARCLPLASQVNRDSREEALPTIEILASSARALLELGATSAEPSCLFPLTAAALFNHPFALVANRTKGVTPLETAIETAKRFPDDADVQRAFLPAITNLADPVGGDELVAEVVQLGGIDAIFAAMHRFTGDNYGDTLMMAWAALSDFTSTTAGAAALANHGGRLQGCGFAVEQMRMHPAPYFAKTALSLTLKYEVLMTIHNMLSQDVDGSYGRSCLDAGIVEQALYTMRVEEGLRAPQDMGCNVLDDMLKQGPAAVSLLREAGAVELARRAVDRFSDGDDTPFVAGRTMGESYPVTPACTSLLDGLGAVGQGPALIGLGAAKPDRDGGRRRRG